MGRIAYPADYGARILPVNYVLADDSIIFRTVPDGEIFHHALNSMCAFEIDDTDEFFESGWSVVESHVSDLRPRLGYRVTPLARDRPRTIRVRLAAAIAEDRVVPIELF